MRQTRGVYLISVAARTLEMHPQTLRKYERAGFIEPLRMGTLRAYSDEGHRAAAVNQALRRRPGPEPFRRRAGAPTHQRTVGVADAAYVR